jgi:hypothetical protein
MNYWLTLLDSDLPFAPWIVVAIWGVLFLCNHLVARAARRVSSNQAFVVIENCEVLERGFRPRFVLGQVLFAGLIFALTLWAEPHPVFVFLGGGVIVALVWLLGMNLQALLSSLGARTDGAVTGSLNLSNTYAIRQQMHRTTSGAMVCGILGAVLAHLALLGGALFLASTAVGYRRRMRS